MKQSQNKYYSFWLNVFPVLFLLMSCNNDSIPVKDTKEVASIDIEKIDFNIYYYTFPPNDANISNHVEAMVCINNRGEKLELYIPALIRNQKSDLKLITEKDTLLLNLGVTVDHTFTIDKNVTRCIPTLLYEISDTVFSEVIKKEKAKIESYRYILIENTKIDLKKVEVDYNFIIDGYIVSEFQDINFERKKSYKLKLFKHLNQNN
jgi:hypothetical protein